MSRKISQLPPASGLSDENLLEIVRYSQSQKLTARQLREYVEQGLGTAAKEDAQVSVVDNRAGRLLSAGAFGWNGGAAILKNSETNINDLRTSGVYALNGPYIGGYPGVTEAIYIRVTVHGPSYIKQEMLGITSNFCASRNMAAGEWYPWEPVYTQDNAVGTVASGAIIEQGSNVNGEFTKFADGTLITRGVRTISYGAGEELPAGRGQAWDGALQPATFVGQPAHNVTLSFMTGQNGTGHALYTLMQSYWNGSKVVYVGVNTGHSPAFVHPPIAYGTLAAGSFIASFQSSGRWKQ